MTNREALAKYGDLSYVAEEIMCFLLQEYWEKHGKTACDKANRGYTFSAMPFNPVTFTKEFMKEETLVNTDVLDNVIVAEKRSILNQFATKTDVVDVEEGSWREITEPISSKEVQPDKPFVADTNDVEFDVIKDPKIHSGRTNGDSYMECFEDAKVEFLGTGADAYVEITFSDGTSRTVPMSWWNAPCGSHL